VKPPFTNTMPTMHDRWLICAVLGTNGRIADAWKAEATVLKNVSIIESHGSLVAVMSITEEIISTPHLGQKMREFSDVVNRLHSFGDILPFRFGMMMSKQEWSRTLEKNESSYRASLDRIAGCSEINLRWAIPDSNDTAKISGNSSSDQKPATGSAYMVAKMEARRLQNQVEKEADAIAKQLKVFYPIDCVDLLSSVRKLSVKNTIQEDVGYSIAKIDLLVRRESVDSILKASSTLRVRSATPTVASGPWPPFSFLVSDEVGTSTTLPMQRSAKPSAIEAGG
jgi:Gas vesicle synthesis protein GvpL/GvpF